jgi:hypothetical protein
MVNEDRKARLQGAMALVASATAELQRLKPRSLRAADVVAKAASQKDSPDLTRTRKPFSQLGPTARLKSRSEKSKSVPSAAKAAFPSRRLRHG